MSKPKPDRITTTFTVSGIDSKVFERFVKFCELNSTVTKTYPNPAGGPPQIKNQVWYAGGIRILLDIAEADAKTQMLFDKLAGLVERIEKLEHGNDV